MGQLAGQQYGAGAQGAGFASALGQNLGQASFAQGSNLANLATGQGGALANLGMQGGQSLAQMLYNTGSQMGANKLAGAGASAQLTQSLLGQYNNPVGYSGGGWQTLSGAGSELANLASTYASYRLSSGGGGGGDGFGADCDRVVCADTFSHGCGVDHPGCGRGGLVALLREMRRG